MLQQEQELTTAAVAYSSEKYPVTPLFANNTEEYSGYTWAAGGSLSQTPSAIRFFNAGTGTQTAALSIGGNTDPVGSVPVTWLKDMMEHLGQQELDYLQQEV
jgi:hypothetical protein